jgi:hypothetical protein
VEKPLVDFLHYVEKSTDEAVPADCDERLKDLHKKISEIKASRQMGVSYMKMEERDRLIREEGEQRVNQLILCLSREGRTDDIVRAAENPEYQQKLLKEYHID